jgi:hypothetical protein
MTTRDIPGIRCARSYRTLRDDGTDLKRVAFPGTSCQATIGVVPTGHDVLLFLVDPPRHNGTDAILAVWAAFCSVSLLIYSRLRVSVYRSTVSSHT